MDSTIIDYVKDGKVLNQVLENSKADTVNLPPLVPDTSWYDGILERMKHLLSKLFHFFDFSGGNFSSAQLLKGLAYGVGLLLVAYLLYLLVMRLTKTSGQVFKNNFSVNPFSKIENSSLEERVTTALSQKDYALASRLRWKLYLQRAGQRVNGTPQEILTSTAVPVFYQLMFDEIKEAPSHYANLHQILTSLEGAGDVQK